MLAASETEDDFVLRLGDNVDGFFRVGIHLVAAILEVNRQVYCSSLNQDNDGELPTPSAVWISPKLSQGPDAELFDYVHFQ